ncbi:septum formation protein [Succinivibrio dextrinosolvens]|uniref:Maf family protein n=1 Tax=Succinivibrio dextrinosolvens TaxID=83771 RepID=UPI0008E491B5|nr:Maf family protein [Succinivibrio dextrinosolvens]SFS70363.1 septum formation protein [Succinivibrio dextrinosolvens]
MTKLILASGSPRRKEFMSYLGIPFEVEIPNIDESPLQGETPSELVLRLSRLKADYISKKHDDTVVVAADTVVCFNGMILGKPSSRDDAFRMIKMLQGQTHTVYTGVTVQKGSLVRSKVVSTEVSFDPLDDDFIRNYSSSGECDDKAGAYAIQGIASIFISEVKGSVSSVVGLPINEVVKFLREFGLNIPVSKVCA